VIKLVCKKCGGTGLSTPRKEEIMKQWISKAYNELKDKSCDEILTDIFTSTISGYHQAGIQILNERGHEI